MIKCPKCWHYNDSEAGFCKKCGRKLEKPEKETPDITRAKTTETENVYEDSFKSLETTYEELRAKMDDLGKGMKSTGFLFYAMRDKVLKGASDLSKDTEDVEKLNNTIAQIKLEKEQLIQTISSKDEEMMMLKQYIDRQNEEIKKLKKMNNKRCRSCNIIFLDDRAYCSYCGGKIE